MSKQKFEDKFKGLLDLGYSKTDISHMDLDDIIHSGTYFGYNVINAPDINYIEVIVTRHNESWIVQEIKNYTNSIYLRSCKNKIWGELDLIEVGKDQDGPCDGEHEVIVVERPHSHPIATHQTNGFISAEDKRRLDLFKFDSDGNVILSPHEHLDYKEGISDLKAKTKELEETKASINHDHDDDYLPIISEKIPNVSHTKPGQVWIQTEK